MTAPRPQAAWVPENTLSINGREEELLWPSKHYTLSGAEIKKLKEYYQNSLYPNVYANPRVSVRVI
jgi:hypothetical protein